MSDWYRLPSIFARVFSARNRFAGTRKLMGTVASLVLALIFRMSSKNCTACSGEISDADGFLLFVFFATESLPYIFDIY